MRPASRRALASLAVAAAAAGLTLVGCGDGDERGGVTKADFVDRADAVCDKWDARIDRAEGDEELAGLIRGLLDELDGLQTPSGDGAEMDRIVASGRSDLQGLTRGEAGAGEPFAEFSRLSADYGLKACAASTAD